MAKDENVESENVQEVYLGHFEWEISAMTSYLLVEGHRLSIGSRLNMVEPGI